MTNLIIYALWSLIRYLSICSSLEIFTEVCDLINCEFSSMKNYYYYYSFRIFFRKRLLYKHLKLWKVFYKFFYSTGKKIMYFLKSGMYISISVFKKAVCHFPLPSHYSFSFHLSDNKCWIYFTGEILRVSRVSKAKS